MKIMRTEAWTVEVSQETPYAVAYGEFDRATLVFLRLETDTGLCGFGSAGCDEHVTGESPADVLRGLNDVGTPIVRGTVVSYDSRCRWAEMLRPLAGCPGARAAIDMALWDLWGQQRDRPLWKLLGEHRDRIATSVTIGILPLAETLTAARHWTARGFQHLKLKGGRDVEGDIERVITVREIAGPDIEIRFDANQGYTVEQALLFAKQTQSAPVAFLEQPTPAGRPDWLGEVRAGGVPVMADEGLVSRADAQRIVSNQWVDLINVKLMKAGGIAEALAIADIAKRGGLGVMIGCMDESALGIAAGLHVALSHPAVRYADLDGHLGLVGDPARPALRLENGVLFPPDGPGLGIEPLTN